MKVKNIVFSGFAAAILMGVAADANAATEIATKAYVDRLDADYPVTAGKYVSAVKQVDGTVDIETADLATSIEENVMIAPTTDAVYNYVAQANNLDTLNLEPVGADGSYIKIVQQTDGVVGATPATFDQTITENSTHNNAPTSLAVYNAIQGASNADLDLTEVGADGSYIKTVAQADGQVSATQTAFDQTIGEGSTHNNAPTTKAVYDAVQGANDDLDGEFPVDAGEYVSAVTQADGAVTVTTAPLATEIADEVMIAPTTDAVYEEIKNIPDPDDCQSALCVWTSQGWKDATSPLE